MLKEVSVPAWQTTAVDMAVRGLPFFYGLLWGCFLAVFFGAVEPSGDALKGFAAFVTALTGAGLGVWGSRSVSERNAARDKRQRAYADYLAVQSAVRAIMELQSALLVIEKKAGKDFEDKFEKLDRNEYARITTTVIAATGQYEEVPTFKDCIETDTDHAKAHRIREVFAFLERMFRRFKNAEEVQAALRIQVRALLHPNTEEGLKRMLETLTENGGYFRRKLGIDL